MPIPTLSADKAYETNEEPYRINRFAYPPDTDVAVQLQTVMSLSPVSYTHLDVYKRQRYGSIKCGRRVYRGLSGSVDSDQYLSTVVRLIPRRLATARLDNPCSLRLSLIHI